MDSVSDLNISGKKKGMVSLFDLIIFYTFLKTSSAQGCIYLIKNTVKQ